MNSSKHSLVPLQAASLCLDCEIITAAHGRCIACGSAALLNIARALNRPSSRRFSPEPQPSIAQIVSTQVVRSGHFLHST